jgi:bacterioferritin (cytochrome b1)
MAGLQEAINIEASLMLQYAIDWQDTDRLGLSIADGLEKLHEQSEGWWQELTSKLLFLEGAPVAVPAKAATHDTVTDILNDSLAAELAAVDQFTVLCKAAYDAGDLEMFHYYQHLAKWHRSGGNGNKGHISWLQKQLWQLKKLGENDYIASKV